MPRTGSVEQTSFGAAPQLRGVSTCCCCFHYQPFVSLLLFLLSECARGVLWHGKEVSVWDRPSSRSGSRTRWRSLPSPHPPPPFRRFLFRKRGIPVFLHLRFLLPFLFFFFHMLSPSVWLFSDVLGPLITLASSLFSPECLPSLLFYFVLLFFVLHFFFFFFELNSSSRELSSQCLRSENQ